MDNEHVLTPTNYPISEGWGERFAHYMPTLRPVCMGTAGNRLLSDSKNIVCVSDRVWSDAAAAGFVVVDDPVATYDAVIDRFSGITPELHHIASVTTVSDLVVAIGATQIPLLIWELLIDIGARIVEVRGRLNPVVAPGIAIVMPVAPTEAMTVTNTPVPMAALIDSVAPSDDAD